MSNWENLITREISLLHDDACNKGYIGIKDVINFDIKECLLINKKGIIKRYLDKDIIDNFYEFLRGLVDKDQEGNIILKSYELDKKLSFWIRNIEKIDWTKLSYGELINKFRYFDKNYSVYWAYFLVVFYIGLAVENTKAEKKISKYKKEIKILRGENSARFRIEKIFLKNFIRELAKRSKIQEKYLWYTLPEEILSFLNKKEFSVSLDELKKRKEYYIWFYKNGKSRYYFNKKEVGELEKKELKNLENKYSKIKVIKGSIGCKGKARGRARILYSSRDFRKVKKNDIIVTPMTDPRYLSVMEKASAFITDEGGMTCHAAIVAREMDKPCVISTKIATLVFRDNDLIEVDANKGVIKKVINK